MHEIMRLYEMLYRSFDQMTHELLKNELKAYDERGVSPGSDFSINSAIPASSTGVTRLSGEEMKREHATRNCSVTGTAVREQAPGEAES